MKELFSLQLIKNDFISLDMKGLIAIVLIIIFAASLIYLVKRIKKQVDIKSPKWQSLTKNVSKISLFLIIISTIVGIFELMGISLANYMGAPLYKTEKILITPSRILFITILILIVWALNLSLKSIFTNYIQSSESQNFASMNIFKLVKYIIWMIAIGIAMQSIGLNLTFVLAGSAALLVGVGIGMQKIFNDMVSGFFLLFEHNLKINDVVEVDGVVGRVIDIGIRTSRILTRDNIEMIVPNSKFINDSVINWSYNDVKTRFFIKIGVAYGSDVDMVKIILSNIAADHQMILKDPKPLVFFRDFGDSSLNFELAFWTAHSLENEIIKSDLRFELNRRLKENNIQIPFPQRDLHIIDKKEVV